MGDPDGEPPPDCGAEARQQAMELLRTRHDRADHAHVLCQHLLLPRRPRKRLGKNHRRERAATSPADLVRLIGGLLLNKTSAMPIYRHCG